MKILLAPDSYKGNMRADEVCEIATQAIHSVIPDAEVISIPMADGGEGTVEAVIAGTHGTIEQVTVTGPLGEKVQGSIGYLPDGKTAIMEMASASGIEYVKRQDLNPMLATTFGTGELIKAALDKGVSEIIMGIGGSATVDGGCGMAQALGFKLLDAEGQDVPQGGQCLQQIAAIDASGVDPRLSGVTIRVACDVTNPLLGEKGAATIFGPQKGATPEMVKELEVGLKNLSECWKANQMIDHVEGAGDGAAGGLGAGLRAFCQARMESGANLVAEVTGYKTAVSDVDLVITGEGCTDGQTEGGKLCSVVAQLAHQHDVPVILISGGLQGDLSNLNKMFDAAFSNTMDIGSLEKAIRASRQNLFFEIQSLMKVLMIGKSLK